MKVALPEASLLWNPGVPPNNSAHRSARLQDTLSALPGREKTTESKRLFSQTLLTDSFLFKTYVSLVTHIQVNERPTKHLCYWHAPQEKIRLGAKATKGRGRRILQQLGGQACLHKKFHTSSGSKVTFPRYKNKQTTTKVTSRLARSLPPQS